MWKREQSDYILEKALAGERITVEDATRLYDCADFLKVIPIAREIRNRRLDPARVTYTMFRVVNYTTFCNVDCSFCSYFEPMGSPNGSVLSKDEIVQKMRDALAIGADQMFLQGGVNPDLQFDYYIDVIRAVKETLGSHIHVRAFSPVELLGMEKVTGMDLRRILRELKAAGVDSVPGAGAEILTDRMRAILSPRKSPTSEWVRVMETCHEEGLPGSANIVFGSEETHAEVMEHLGVVRDLQDRTGGFLAFIPWTFQKQTKKFKVRTVPPHEYLKVLGICRIFLDNIPHIEASLMVLGQSTGSLALHSGADDISSIVIEENVLKSYGLKTEERAREFIRESGFIPARRDLLYRLREESCTWLEKRQ
jgi:cyclic dehypoxanthinyl futalosine synthase